MSADTYEDDVDKSVYEIFDLIKNRKVSSGSLFYRPEDPSSIYLLIKALRANGLQAVEVYDGFSVELLTYAHPDTATGSRILKVEWDAEFVISTWPTLVFEDPEEGNIYAPWSIYYGLQVASAVSALVFILASFLCALFLQGSVIPEVLVVCGLGSLILLGLSTFKRPD